MRTLFFIILFVIGIIVGWKIYDLSKNYHNSKHKISISHEQIIERPETYLFILNERENYRDKMRIANTYKSKDSHAYYKKQFRKARNKLIAFFKEI